jgi:4-oxalocrotonate tautomerase
MPLDTVRLLQREATRLMVEVMGKREAVTAVAVEQVPAEHWAIGGQAISQPTAFVDVKISRGTNTEAQKAALLSALQRLLLQALGDLAEASYVVIHEVPTTDWGYAGRSQADRSGAG